MSQIFPGLQCNFLLRHSIHSLGRFAHRIRQSFRERSFDDVRLFDSLNYEPEIDTRFSDVWLRALCLERILHFWCFEECSSPIASATFQNLKRAGDFVERRVLSVLSSQSRPEPASCSRIRGQLAPKPASLLFHSVSASQVSVAERVAESRFRGDSCRLDHSDTDILHVDGCDSGLSSLALLLFEGRTVRPSFWDSGGRSLFRFVSGSIR